VGLKQNRQKNPNRTRVGISHFGGPGSIEHRPEIRMEAQFMEFHPLRFLQKFLQHFSA